MSAAETVTTMIAAWERLDAAAVTACFFEDGIWHNMPFGPIAGRAAIASAVEAFLADMTEAEFIFRHQGEIAAGVVVNERTDIFRSKDGKVLTIPVMGVFEIENGEIRAWRDYFDANVMNG